MTDAARKTWKQPTVDTRATGGRFVRDESRFRNWITADGSPGPSGTGGFKTEPGRYHLYVSPACPWAHRTLIFRKLKGLESFITVSAVNAHMGDLGWSFDAGPGVIADQVNHARYLYEIYRLADPDYAGRATVPVLWDKQRGTLVNNESSEIIRMFNSAFDGVGAAPGDFYPASLRAAIDELNAEIYANVNNGVYRAGFASTQEAYEEAVRDLFRTLDKLEARLGHRRYLTGDRITEADWRLFPTLLRFDPVYVGHFKCNWKRLVDYPNLWGYTRDLFQQPGIAETVDIAYIKAHYYTSHKNLNPSGIVPIGPDVDFTLPHRRG